MDLRCPNCGYDVRGLPTSTCPECGADTADPGIRLEPPPSFIRTILLLASATPLAVAGTLLVAVLAGQALARSRVSPSPLVLIAGFAVAFSFLASLALATTRWSRSFPRRDRFRAAIGLLPWLLVLNLIVNAALMLLAMGILFSILPR
jgi:hypothetical protein